MTISVVLVDDQALLRMGFRLVLEAEDDLTVIGEAADGQAAVQMVAAAQPDVVLMDVRMPGMNGIDATRQITANHPRTRVLILTTFDLDEYAFEGLQAGASGFLLKDTQPRELTGAIRTVAHGDAVVSPRVTRRLLEIFAGREGFGQDLAITPTRPEGRNPEASAALPQLTDREVEVLLAIAEGLSNGEIAARLVVSEATVKTHVGKVLAKLGLRDRVQAAVYAYQNGLIQPHEP